MRNAEILTRVLAFPSQIARATAELSQVREPNLTRSGAFAKITAVMASIESLEDYLAFRAFSNEDLNAEKAATTEERVRLENASASTQGWVTFS